ncbi:MAG: hypothetical protein HY897_14615 [Deltaproteobacteria bacterium]|nr:hypothetical protein [Deltaproteobacteria bacterium]
MEKAADLYKEMEYDKAVILLNELEGRSDLTRKQTIDVLKLKAFIQILIVPERERAAFITISRIYEMDPAFRLDETAPPPFRNFFERVKILRESVAKKSEPPPLQPPKAVEQPQVQKKDGQAETPEHEDKTRVLSVEKTQQPAGSALLIVDDGKNGPLDFVRDNWLSLSCVGLGVALLVPGVVMGLEVRSYDGKLAEYPKDERGRLIGITSDEAKDLQDEADTKALTSNLLLLLGAAAVAGGVVTFLISNDIIFAAEVAAGTGGVNVAVMGRF